MNKNWQSYLLFMASGITTLATIASVVTLSPSVAATGLLMGGSTIYLIKPKSRRERELIQLEAQFSDWETNLLEIQSSNEQKAQELLEKENQLAQINAQIQPFQQERLDFEKYKERVYQEIVGEARIQAESHAIAIHKQQWEQLLHHQTMLNNVLPQLTAEAEEQVKQVEAYYQEQFNQIVAQTEQYQQDCQKKIAEIQQFYYNFFMQVTKDTQLELHQLKIPKLPPPEVYEEHPKAALIAERTLGLLHDNGVYADYEDCVQEQDFGNWSAAILIRPKKGLLNFIEDFNNTGKLLPALQALAPGCEAPPEYKIWQMCLRLDFDLSGTTKQQRIAKENTKQIEELPANWLEGIIKYCVHFRINGQTRSGKSTFVNNLLGLMRRMSGGEVEIILIDPKYPMSRWSIEPKYKGLDDSIYGLQEMGKEIERRLRQATEDVESGKEIRDFKPIIYIIDEVDWVAGHYNEPTPPIAAELAAMELPTKKAASYLLKKGLKVGAALKVMCCYIGQSPLCSSLGMNKNDFNHSANFFLGENILPAIKEVAYSHQQKYLVNQYKLRLERSEKYLGTEEQNKYKFFALVKAPGMTAKLVSLPLEGAYDFYPVEEQAGEQEKLAPAEPIKWHKEADAELLVESAKKQIQALISEGYTKPLDIAKHIWGNAVHPQAKPYNGKNGVKERITVLIKEAKSLARK